MAEGPMSKARRARGKKGGGHVRKGSQGPALMTPVGEGASSRIALARRRGDAAKVGIGAAGVLGAGASMGLAEATYAGHQRHVTPPLSIPQPLYAVVRQN